MYVGVCICKRETEIDRQRDIHTERSRERETEKTDQDGQQEWGEKGEGRERRVIRNYKVSLCQIVALAVSHLRI